MKRSTTYIWNQMPFVRLVIPLMAGIMLQWYFQFPLSNILTFSSFVIGPLLAFTFLKFSLKYSLRWIQGAFIVLLMMALGALITYQHDVRHDKHWVGNYANDSSIVLATLQEPLVEKAKSYKAEATIDAINISGEWHVVNGSALLYFNKENTPPSLHYGSQILFSKTLQRIKNSGNPGSFDYERYTAFQNIFHQVFLKSNEYVISSTTNINPFKNWLINVRFAVIRTLDKFIADKKQAGVAEALLIGYRDNLDKELVQAYSNTGVVHIIAISGLHLGLIYGVLASMFKIFRRRKWVRWAKPVVILSVLWIFTFIAGGVPSILRSAVMFTFIILAETISKKSSIYNTLAASAFVMLCYDPYFLWDVGFQLSYAAVFSIIIFMRPIYNWFYVRNKFLDGVWELMAVTLSAQVLTLPIILYYFHQFPNLFLITNFVVVPLSSVILFAELLLLGISVLPIAAKFVGLITGGMLQFMNDFIERLNALPFSVYNNVQNSVAQTIVLYVVIIALCYWLYKKYKPSLFIAISAAIVFISLESFDNIRLKKELKVVVYNVPKMEAIDFMEDRKFVFVGDTALMADGFLKNFHLQPCRTLNKVKPSARLNDLDSGYPFFEFAGKKILLIDRSFSFTSTEKLPVDLIIISKNPRVYITQIAAVFDCKQYVFDASNSLWKINRWKKDCDSLHLRHYSTPDQGAFEWKL